MLSQQSADNHQVTDGRADEAYLIGPYHELLTVLRRDRPSPQAPGAPAPGPALAPHHTGDPD